jgi:uncharacterized MnhB-related membrane protein
MLRGQPKRSISATELRTSKASRNGESRHIQMRSFSGTLTHSSSHAKVKKRHHRRSCKIRRCHSCSRRASYADFSFLFFLLFRTITPNHNSQLEVDGDVITTWIAADNVMTARELFEAVAAEGFSVQVKLEPSSLLIPDCLFTENISGNATSTTAFRSLLTKTQRVSKSIL